MIILHPTDIELIPINNNITLFYHASSLQVYPLSDREIIQFLLYFKAYGYDKTLEKYDIKEEFHDIYDFVTNKISETYHPPIKKEIVEISDVSFNSIVLPISGSCNLRCPYCFAQTNGKFNFKNYTKDDVDKTIKYIIENNPDEVLPINIIFFGGEPFLNLPIIKYTIDLLKEKYSNRKISYSATTNGTIINQEIINIIKENNISILISIDGPDNEFNLRRFGNNVSSLSTVLKNIDLLTKNNINIQIRATFVSNNPYLVETYRFFEDLKIPFNIVFAYISENKDHSEFTSYNKETLKLIEKQFNDVITFYMKKIDSEQPIYNTSIHDTYESIKFRQSKKIVCGGGIHYFTIMADGNIFSCPHLMNDIQYKIGHINSRKINNKDFVPIDVDNIKDCDRCWIKYLCAGGCFAQKISMNKSNHLAMNSNECQLEKIKWIFYLKIFYYIMIKNPNYFDEIVTD
jgi:radical SAM protein with 4Fe4S-binding SPASM domain